MFFYKLWKWFLLCPLVQISYVFFTNYFFVQHLRKRGEKIWNQTAPSSYSRQEALSVSHFTWMWVSCYRTLMMGFFDLFNNLFHCILILTYCFHHGINGQIKPIVLSFMAMENSSWFLFVYSPYSRILLTLLFLCCFTEIVFSYIFFQGCLHSWLHLLLFSQCTNGNLTGSKGPTFCSPYNFSIQTWYRQKNLSNVSWSTQLEAQN